MEIQIKILELRKKGGMTQQAMADSLNVSRQTVSRWETGSVLPDVDNLSRIANLFQVSVDYLLDVEDPDNKIEENETEDVSFCQGNFTHEILLEDIANKKQKKRLLFFCVCFLFVTILSFSSPNILGVLFVFLLVPIIIVVMIANTIKKFKSKKEGKS